MHHREAASHSTDSWRRDAAGLNYVQEWARSEHIAKEPPELSSAAGPLFERHGGMAVLAVASERPLVNVVPAVTAVAVRGHGNLCHRLRRVAGVALQSLMRTGQRISGLRGMIEAPTRPAIGVVALATIGRQPAFVMGVLMAIGAGPRRVLEARRAMAFLTRDHRMATNQRKARHVMVESDFLAPAGFLVAILALRAELAFVCIIFLMTGHTRHRELVAVDMPGVT
jgi:hypothetical protein